MRDQVEAYAVYVASVAGTVFAFVLAQLNALGGSNVLPAILALLLYWVVQNATGATEQQDCSWKSASMNTGWKKRRNLL